MKSIDHPIFQESIRYIRSRLGYTGFGYLEQQVLERLIHTTGDFSIQSFLSFSQGACEAGLKALHAGAPIITDTNMASAAISPMAARTINCEVICILDWVLESNFQGVTRTSVGMERACLELSGKFIGAQAPIFVIGSAPKALETLVHLVDREIIFPNLVIGMPVGFINVLESKTLLSNSKVNQIRIDGHRGGAALASAAINALLRETI